CPRPRRWAIPSSSSRPHPGCGTAPTSVASGWTSATPTRYGRRSPRSAPVILQEMAAPGVATVVEIVDDPSFGALVSFGLGGVATDLLGDRAYRTLPL